MRLSISNIAWTIEEDEQVASLLNKYGIDAIDVAPSKYFANLKDTRPCDTTRVRTWWHDHGIEITGMQSLLFGTSGLNLFGSHNSQVAMLEQLESGCRIGAGLGAKKLVFGSPKNRDRSGLSDEESRDIAIRFFRLLGNIASRHGVTICLEPNPPCYGANFMTNSDDTASIVTLVDHKSIRMQLDTGALAINNETPEVVIKNYTTLIGHVHASEPNLVTLGDGITDHATIALHLAKRMPEQVVTIEMLPAYNELKINAIERAIGVAICYRYV